MEQSERYGLLTARILIAVVFLLNGLGIIDQSLPARELAERGVPASLVPIIMLSGRALELIAGFTLALGILPRLLAMALFVFPVPATFVSHSFWLAAGTPAFQGQLINFCKNTAILGGLLFHRSRAGPTQALGEDMINVPAMLLAIPAVSGIVDAVSLGHVFTANMTGNIVFLGFAIGGIAGLSIWRSLLALAFFMSGAVLAGYMTRTMKAQDPGSTPFHALAVETILLWVHLRSRLDSARRMRITSSSSRSSSP